MTVPMSAVPSEPHLAALLERWNQQWSPCPPIAYKLRTFHPERWVRFHSLPESKRYAAGESEMATILERHYAVLSDLFAGRELVLITCTWSEVPEPPERSALDVAINPHATPWLSLLTDDDPDPEFRTYTHLYVDHINWSPGSLDPLLRAAARYETGGAMLADANLSRVYHPYDGGADVLLADTTERDLLKTRYTNWLSPHPTGL
jgi:hypothetical protein